MSYSKQQSLFRDYTKANLKMRMDEIRKDTHREDDTKAKPQNKENIGTQVIRPE